MSGSRGECRPIRIGITGTIAAGKSRVADHWRSLGAAIVDGDALGHELRQRPDVDAAIVAAFGVNDRQRLGRIVFADPAARRRLEAILHPAMQAEAEARLSASSAPLTGLDAAVLFESGWQVPLDATVCVDADPLLRQSRAATRGWDAGEFNRRGAAQWPAARKRAAADLLILNDDWDRTRRTLDALAAAWGLAPAPNRGDR